MAGSLFCGAFRRRPGHPHAILSGLRITFQPASFLQFGFTSALQAFGEGGIALDAFDFVAKHFVPELDDDGHSANGLMAYDLVLSLPFIREMTFLHGMKFYWQRGQDNVRNVSGVLGGGNILGGVIDGGRWISGSNSLKRKMMGECGTPTLPTRVVLPLSGLCSAIPWAEMLKASSRVQRTMSLPSFGWRLMVVVSAMVSTPNLVLRPSTVWV